MCGFAGYLTPERPSSEVAEARLRAMGRAIASRGPDGDGVWHDDEAGIGLAHRRLAILDLSPAGAQPMTSASGRFVLAYNGEVYNHLDLRGDLNAAGQAPQWRGHSDTETLLAAVEAWGLDETLHRAEGMFALAIWDRKTRILSLARDRMGEKPLYWGWAGKALVFGSQLKALRQHPDCSGEICPKALQQYFRFAYIPAPLSIHPGIYKLEPGCVLQVDQVPPPMPSDELLRPAMNHGSLSIRRYWSLGEVLAAGHADPIEDPEEAVSLLETTLKEAVARQSLSDVPLGAFLSGGIDSSLIVSLMQASATRRVETFTIGFENPAYDESPHAAAVARHLGTNHSTMMVTDADARDVIPKLPDLYDEPFADSSQIPTFLVSQAARKNVTVALTGDGGDELFGGYNRHLWAPRVWKRVGWMPGGMRRGLGAAMDTVPPAAWDQMGALAGRFSSRAAISRPGEKAQKLANRLRHANSLTEFYLSLATVGTRHEGPVPPLLSDPLPEALSSEPAGWIMAQDMRSYLPDDILCKVDRAAMGVSLESRVPFLDPRVIALSARITSKVKLRDGKSKWPLRALLDRHVPRSLIDRPKIGFGIPLEEWLQGPLREWAGDLRSSTESITRDLGEVTFGLETTSEWSELLLRQFLHRLKRYEDTP